MGMKRRPPPLPVPTPAPLSAEPATETVEVADTAALKRLAVRMDTKVDQVDNSRSYAGSPMVYYCKLCSHWAATLPESHWGSPTKHCKECKELLEASGLTPTTLRELVKDYRKEPVA